MPRLRSGGAMRTLLASFLLCGSLPLANGVAVKEIVNNVAWWPPSNLQFEEAVGVVSRGLMFATGMMENTTDPAGAPFDTHQLALELLDVRDIVVAANTSLEHLVDCLANVAAGGAAKATAALVKALGGPSGAPCITVVESQGEDPMYNSSISCIAAVSKDGKNTTNPIGSRHRASTRTAIGLVATTVVEQTNGMLWLSAAAPVGTPNPAGTETLWATISQALATATGKKVDASDAVDCTVLVPLTTPEADVANIQHAVRAATTSASRDVEVAAQLTVVKTTLGAGQGAKVRCTAVLGGGKMKRQHVHSSHGERIAGATPSVTTVVAGGFAYVSGVGSVMRNTTDAFHEISKSLVAAGSRMNLVLNCLFWVTSEDVIDPFFGGFQQAFNVEAFPPPSRTEFVGVSPRSQCLGGATGPCPVLCKCVAAMPVNDGALL